jgi:hypothetical protein
MNLVKHSDILKNYNPLQGSTGSRKDTDDINIERCKMPGFSASPDIAFTLYSGQCVAFLTTERIDNFECFPSLISGK